MHGDQSVEHHALLLAGSWMIVACAAPSLDQITQPGSGPGPPQIIADDRLVRDGCIVHDMPDGDDDIQEECSRQKQPDLQAYGINQSTKPVVHQPLTCRYDLDVWHATCA